MHLVYFCEQMYFCCICVFVLYLCVCVCVCFCCLCVCICICVESVLQLYMLLYLRVHMCFCFICVHMCLCCSCVCVYICVCNCVFVLFVCTCVSVAQLLFVIIPTVEMLRLQRMHFALLYLSNTQSSDVDFQPKKQKRQSCKAPIGFVNLTTLWTAQFVQIGLDQVQYSTKPKTVHQIVWKNLCQKSSLLVIFKSSLSFLEGLNKSFTRTQ